MSDHVVRVVYVEPGVGGAGADDLYRYMAEIGLYVIGEVKPPDEALDYWMVSIRQPDLEGIYLQYWPQLLNGETGIYLPLPANLEDINRDIFSPGKQRLAQELLADLQAGLIDTLSLPEMP